MKNQIKYIFSLALFTMLLSQSMMAAPVVRQGTGANTAALQGIVDTFRNDLGGTNNGVGGSFVDGRREINWDGVPDSFAVCRSVPRNIAGRCRILRCSNSRNGGNVRIRVSWRPPISS